MCADPAPLPRTCQLRHTPQTIINRPHYFGPGSCNINRERAPTGSFADRTSSGIVTGNLSKDHQTIADLHSFSLLWIPRQVRHHKFDFSSRTVIVIARGRRFGLEPSPVDLVQHVQIRVIPVPLQNHHHYYKRGKTLTYASMVMGAFGGTSSSRGDTASIE